MQNSTLHRFTIVPLTHVGPTTLDSSAGFHTRKASPWCYAPSAPKGQSRPLRLSRRQKPYMANTSWSLTKSPKSATFQAEQANPDTSFLSTCIRIRRNWSSQQNARSTSNPTFSRRFSGAVGGATKPRHQCSPKAFHRRRFSAISMRFCTAPPIGNGIMNF